MRDEDVATPDEQQRAARSTLATIDAFLNGRPRAALHVEQHDDEEEQRDDRARVNQQQQERQKEGIELHEQAGHADQAEQQAHRRVDRVLVQTHHAPAREERR